MRRMTLACLLLLLWMHRVWERMSLREEGRQPMLGWRQQSWLGHRGRARPMWRGQQGLLQLQQQWPREGRRRQQLVLQLRLRLLLGLLRRRWQRSQARLLGRQHWRREGAPRRLLVLQLQGLGVQGGRQRHRRGQLWL